MMIEPKLSYSNYFPCLQEIEQKGVGKSSFKVVIGQARDFKIMDTSCFFFTWWPAQITPFRCQCYAIVDVIPEKGVTLLLHWLSHQKTEACLLSMVLLPCNTIWGCK
uniref:Uncharacterized protein n=1 Tax=Cacopsylla melanoneura TaxID=428564 RepID=A0A8D8W9G8_9HEMI